MKILKQKFTVNDVVNAGTCWSRERIKSYFGSRESMTLGELFDSEKTGFTEIQFVLGEIFHTKLCFGLMDKAKNKINTWNPKQFDAMFVDPALTHCILAYALDNGFIKGDK